MQNLTIMDRTQVGILEHVAVTERLLATAASKASGKNQDANIWALPDLGVSHAINSLLGGFFTGAFYTWNSDVPIVPVDANVCCCGVAVFRVKSEIRDKKEFDALLKKAKFQIESENLYEWNFSSGNHFVTYGEVRGSQRILDGHYIIFHSSEDRLNNQYEGLFPINGNWYFDKIKVLEDNQSGRIFRYIDGTDAELFFKKARHLEKLNQDRHHYFAEVFFKQHVGDEVVNLQHCGMPTSNSIAIGCQWLCNSSVFLLLTAPMQPMFFIEKNNAKINQLYLQGKELSLYPHGLGTMYNDKLTIKYLKNELTINSKKYGLSDSLKDSQNLQIRQLDTIDSGQAYPQVVANVLSKCPGNVIGKLEPKFSYYKDSAKSYEALE